MSPKVYCTKNLIYSKYVNIRDEFDILRLVKE